jgi:hypothetical protein
LHRLKIKEIPEVFVKFDDWSQLPGTEVEIWLSGRLARTGVIDSATADSSIAWAAADGSFDRKLFEKANGVELRVHHLEAIQRAERST